MVINKQKMVDESQEIFTTEQLCNLLHVSSRTLQRWRDYGIIKFSAVGKKHFYLKQDVLAMLDKFSINN